MIIKAGHINLSNLLLLAIILLSIHVIFCLCRPKPPVVLLFVRSTYDLLILFVKTMVDSVKINEYRYFVHRYYITCVVV